jgi:hypothetical protein
MSGTPLPLLKWEYARLESTAEGVNVVFTHHESWTGISADAFFDTMRKLGDEGWELVTAVPLAAGAELEADAPSSPSAATRAGPRKISLRLETDRWLVFKRPQPPEPEKGSAQADLVRDLVQRQLLKGRFPLP